jgi:hypothetical protein
VVTGCDVLFCLLYMPSHFMTHFFPLVTRNQKKELTPALQDLLNTISETLKNFETFKSHYTKEMNKYRRPSHFQRYWYPLFDTHFLLFFSFSFFFPVS